jgi:tetratricopeptide (TPR) repeat protein
MNPTINQFVILFLSLFLFGCNGNTDKTVSVTPRSEQAILSDSLQKLNSLVLKYRAKHADAPIGYARFLYNLGMLNRRAGNYKNCIFLLDSALRFSITVNDSKTKSNSLNSLGSFYYDIGEKEIARKMFDSAFAVAKNESLYPQMGSALGNLARFEPDEKKSIAMSRLAISYLERSRNSPEQIAMILINIGNRHSDTDSALLYYQKAINMVRVDYAPEVIIGAYNNLAYCYLGKGDIKNAEKCIVDHALPVAEKTNNIDWQSTVYDTYADVLQQKRNSGDAMVYRNKAIDVNKTFRASVSGYLLSKKNN